MAIHPWATSSVARSSVASLATRARPSERRSVRDDGTGSVRFVFLFSRRVRFCDGPTDGRSARSIEEGFKTRIVDQFILGFVLATDRFDPIRSDPTRSFASGSLRALSNRDARGFHLDEVNKNLRDAVPSARLGVAGVVDVDVRASERSVARAIRFRSPTRSALARESSAGRRGRGRVARRFVRSPGSTASATVRSVRSFARRSRRSFARRHPSHPSIRRSVVRDDPLHTGPDLTERDRRT